MVDNSHSLKIMVIVLTIICLFLIYLKHEEEDPNISEIKHRISPIFPEIMNMKIYLGSMSTTVSKRDIYLDVYKRDGTPYDLNTMVYVCLHEISHVICDVMDVTDKHSKEFHEIFDKLVLKATELKVFNPSIPLDPDYMK